MFRKSVFENMENGFSSLEPLQAESESRKGQLK